MARKVGSGSYRAAGPPRPAPVRERVAAYRKRMRAKGYKPVEIWVPDTNNPKFIAELKRQSRLCAKIESKDARMEQWLTANAAAAFTEIDRAEEAAGAPYPFWDEKAEKPV